MFENARLVTGFAISIVLMLIPGSVVQAATGSTLYEAALEETREWRDAAKVDGYVFDELEALGKADFFIVLKEQADFSGAKDLKTKKEKGLYVYERLVKTAERSQGDLKEFLDTRGARYRSFIIQNMILVYDGGYELLREVVQRKGVAEIRGNRPYVETHEQRLTYDAPEGKGVEWSIIHINADEIWDEGYTGEGIVVANLDTGVDWDHPALKEKYRGWSGSSVDHDYNWHACSTNYYCPDASVACDDDGHGTHTMGTMVGDDGGSNQVGVAPGAQWIACGHLEDEAGFHECFEWFLAPYAYGQGPGQGLPEKAPDVVNNSWGWPVGGGDYQYAPDIDALQAAGVFMEFSAGNEGDYCETLRSPGDYPQVLSTGASDSQDRIVSESWTYWGSSRGPADDNIPGAPDFIKPEIVAPGYDIRSSVPGGGYEGGWGGTSMAGPHTCGVVALLWSASPQLIGDIETTRNLIIDSAYTDPDGQYPGAGFWNQTCEGINAYDTIPNHVWGWGLLDAYAAFQMLSGVSMDKEAYMLEDLITINVLDRSASGFVSVQITSTRESDPETVICYEQEEGSFEGSITCSDIPPSGGDGILSVSHGDLIECYYPNLDMTATAQADGQAPVITGVGTDNVGSETASVVWTTDESATTVVYYGVGTPDMTYESEDLATDHSADLTGLSDCTVYSFYVESSDAAGNTAVDDNGGEYYTFVTDQIMLMLYESMDSDPGWTTEDDWEWGQPTGQGGSYGSPDPTEGYNGDNVYGYNLNGDYTNYMSSTEYLITGSIDCSEAEEVLLEFQRWLGLEQHMYDEGYIDVSSDGGSTWNNVWTNSETLDGGAWELMEYDLTAWAAGQSNVRIRWGIGPTDVGWTYCGWNIDEVRIFSTSPCNPGTPTYAPTPQTPTYSPTRTPTIPSTDTPTRTPTISSTYTPTRTPTNTNPPTYTPTPTSPPTLTPTWSPTNSPTQSPTRTPTTLPPTFTPTFTLPPTSTPTKTPSPTFTQEPTESPEPTATPYETAIPTQTGTATEPTSTPRPATATPSTPQPTPTVFGELGVKLEMPSTMFYPEDPCYLMVYLNNPDEPLVDVPLFVILDVYGIYYYGPAWNTIPAWYTQDVPLGTTSLMIINEFSWPHGAGSAEGIIFWAGMTTPQMDDLLGQFDSWTFGWKERLE